MKIINSVQDFRFWRKKVYGTIGYVPTMGALHGGHISLIEKSIKQCDNTVISIYVNPLQFSIDEDFDLYPKNFESDLKALSDLKVNAIFFPTDSTMYPENFSTFVKETKLSKVLEGKSRPDFFQGVATVVIKLFNIVKPTHVFFGEKDAQQLFIVKKMIDDLAYDIKLIPCQIIRDNNGLALSSRNKYLSEKNKKLASLIYKSLMSGKKLLEVGERNAKIVKKEIITNLEKEVFFKTDYVSIANMDTLLEVDDKIDCNVLVSVAVYFENIRLIDNFYFLID